VFAGTDSGRTFTARATGHGDPWLSLKGNGLYRSTGAGATFAKVSSCHAAHTLGFGKAARGAFYPAIYMVGVVESFNAVYRSDDQAKTWTRINDDQHQWGWTGAAITGDPRVYGRVYVSTNGRGVQYGDPADTTNHSQNRGN
jgi:hypothetical protein